MIGGRVAANDEAIAGDRDDRRLEADLHVRALARLQLSGRLVDETHVAEELGGEVVEADSCLFLQRFRVRKQIETGGDDLRRAQRPRPRQLLAAMEILGRDVGEVDGRSLSRRCELAWLAVYLDRARAAAFIARQHFDLRFDVEPSGERGAGDDRAEAFHREDAIDRKPEHARRRVTIVD